MATRAGTLQAGPAGEQRRRLRSLVIVPAYNEEGSLREVIEEIRAADADLSIVVINDCSTDETPRHARAAGVAVVNLPFNIGIGGAMKTGYQYARDNGFEVAVQIDADGQHDAAHVARLITPISLDAADMVIGTRFAGEREYHATPGRRAGMILFSWATRLITRKRLTDPTSGFRAVNRRGIELFAAEYPPDFPEVESNVLAARNGLRILEVPVTMRQRAAGRSTVTTLRGTYFVIRILLALFVSVFRRTPKPMEEG
jgi:glycosyltransferase involved in cell wall biosynthesis